MHKRCSHFACSLGGPDLRRGLGAHLAPAQPLFFWSYHSPGGQSLASCQTKCLRPWHLGTILSLQTFFNMSMHAHEHAHTHPHTHMYTYKYMHTNTPPIK